MVNLCQGIIAASSLHVLADSVHSVKSVRTECGGPRGQREYARGCAEYGGSRAERRTEMTRSTERKPLEVPWRDERGKEGRGSGGKEGRRQGGREHYSVESDALPENERENGYHAENIRSNVYNPDKVLRYMSADLYTTRNVHMRETRVV